MTVTEVTAKRSDSADDPDAVRSPEPGSREPAGRRPRIVPFLITLAAVALAGLLGWTIWASTWAHRGPVMPPCAPM